jgi:hypothetical protein
MAVKHTYYVNDKSFTILHEALVEWRTTGRGKMYRRESRVIRLGDKAWPGIYTEEYHPARGWHNGRFEPDPDSIRQYGPCPRA